MLNVLRESFKETPYLKWVLAIVGIGLVAYLGNYFMDSGSSAARSDWIARVNGTEIPEWRFRQRAQQTDEYYRNLFGENYEQLKERLQIRRQTLNALVEEQVVLQDAERLGLECSSAQLAERVRTHPSLQDEEGRFIGTERYKQALARNYPGGYVAFERLLAEDLLEARWTALVTEPVRVDDDELWDLFRQRTEKTAMRYVLIEAAEQKVDRDVDEATLQRWFADHAGDYRREAGRKIRFVLVDREDLLQRIDVPAPEIQAYYEANQASYSHPEQRRARHILFRLEPGASAAERQEVRARAEGALERLRAGAEFASIARELSEDPVSAERGGDLDFFGRGVMDDAFESAVFGTAVGQIAPLTESSFGLHIIEVTDGRPAGVEPLASVEDSIRHLLRLRRVDERVRAEAERLHKAVGQAQALEQVAEREGYKVQSAFLNASGRIPELGATADLDRAVADLAPGVLSAPLSVGAGRVLVVVDEVLPEAPAPFEEVRDRVLAAVRDERARQSALAKARVTFERQTTLDGAAKALGLPARESGDLAPGQVPPDVGTSSAEIEATLFGPEARTGRRGVVATPGGAMIYEISRREPVDSARFETEKGRLREELLEERRSLFRQSMVDRLKSRTQIEYNPRWLEALESERG
jgi:peptidyl-prolyl cis-trans isomerase D